MTLTELSKAIAGSGKWAPRPGMACRDPNTHIRFRWMESETDAACGYAWAAGHERAKADREGGEPVFRRAIAAGPDLTDACTVGGLLADLPAFSLSALPHDTWACHHPDATAWGVDSRAEAIAAAWLQYQGVTP